MKVVGNIGYCSQSAADSLSGTDRVEPGFVEESAFVLFECEKGVLAYVQTGRYCDVLHIFHPVKVSQQSLSFHRSHTCDYFRI
jgi:hypothetical protein